MWILILDTVGISWPSPPYQVDNQLVLLFLILTGKLYTMGLLRTLNSKVNFRERFDSTDIGRTSLSDWSWQASAASTTEKTDDRAVSVKYWTANPP